jgi:hypothetical protein
MSVVFLAGSLLFTAAACVAAAVEAACERRSMQLTVLSWVVVGQYGLERRQVELNSAVVSELSLLYSVGPLGLT